MIKNKTFIALILAFVLSQQFSCTKIDNGSFVEPITLYEKIKGNWKLTALRQIDETAIRTDSQPQEMSLFDQFNFDSFTISLDVDDKNQPTSYEVKGSSPEFFPKKGYWELNAAFLKGVGSQAPLLYLYSDVEKSNLIGKLALTTIPGTNKEMELTLTRTEEGVAFVSYKYRLSAD